MRTRKGIVNTLVGILDGKIDESKIPIKEVAENIVDYLIGEENLLIPHERTQSNILISFKKFSETRPKDEFDDELVYEFLIKQSKQGKLKKPTKIKQYLNSRLEVLTKEKAEIKQNMNDDGKFFNNKLEDEVINEIEKEIDIINKLLK